MADQAIKKELPSGAKLEITVSDFATAKRLYQVIAEEAKGLQLTAGSDVAVLLKEVLFTALSSQKIEAAIWECLKRCTYNGVRITPDTFEPIEARPDYIPVLLEVAEENVRPFMKSLYARFAELSGKITSALA